MGAIFDMAGQKMASIGNDGVVYSAGTGKRLGHVGSGGEVYDSMGVQVGHVTGKGEVYKAGIQIGWVKNTGYVYDYENRCVGKTEGDHIEFGGAALLLLVR